MLGVTQVKAEHQLPVVKLQSLLVPVWKWENIVMDFIVSLLKSQLGRDMIWVVVDRLTKSTNFLPVHNTGSKDKLVQLYIDEIMRLHGVPISIVSDRSPVRLAVLESFDWTLGTCLDFSTTYHPNTDGQSERTN